MAVLCMQCFALFRSRMYPSQGGSGQEAGAGDARLDMNALAQLIQSGQISLDQNTINQLVAQQQQQQQQQQLQAQAVNLLAVWIIVLITFLLSKKA